MLIDNGGFTWHLWKFSCSLQVCSFSCLV
jgi:hypothetical protein